ncbi:hypothetical protein [Sphingobacterium tabacisoli]|uniref:Uncharacterized protein n=1 Tax=Sphingobacterium tabacisoli TaxID=2044855 RepID=A0ABW5KYI5_9SPHI|nr:hypothetical protein [Sphingobacterium tabacisoli]
MKKPFNVSGVAAVQSWLMQLSDQDLALELQLLQKDPVVWLLLHFEFTPSQEQQLRSLTTDFLEALAQALANSWQNRELVAFQKNEPPAAPIATKDKSHNKDVLFFGTTSSQQRIAEDSRPLSSSALAVQIIYS